jgi:hypothetical protein
MFVGGLYNNKISLSALEQRFEAGSRLQSSQLSSFERTLEFGNGGAGGVVAIVRFPYSWVYAKCFPVTLRK